MNNFLERKNLKEFRLDLLKKQDFICPLCNTIIKEEDAALDHDHITGHIRGVLHLTCNAYEGVIQHKFRRSGVHKLTDIITYLENLIKYWNKDYSMNFLHPSEKPKEPKIGKREFKKLAKLYSELYPNRKPLEYPKSKKWTKMLKEMKSILESKDKNE